MPQLPAVSKVVRADFHMTLAGSSIIQNRVFFQYTGALSSSDAATWAAAMASNWQAHTMLHLSTQLVLASTVLTDLSSTTAAQVVDGTTGTGGDAAACSSAGLAIVVKQKIARRYRGGHPHHYLAGIPQHVITGVTSFDASYRTSVLNDWNTFISNVLTAVPAAAAPASEVSVSYFQGFHNVTMPSGRQVAIPTLRVSPVVDLVLSHSINPKPASQRRRNEQSP